MIRALLATMILLLPVAASADWCKADSTDSNRNQTVGPNLDKFFDYGSLWKIRCEDTGTLRSFLLAGDEDSEPFEKTEHTIFNVLTHSTGPQMWIDDEAQEVIASNRIPVGKEAAASGTLYTPPTSGGASGAGCSLVETDCYPDEPSTSGSADVTDYQILLADDGNESYFRSGQTLSGNLYFFLFNSGTHLCSVSIARADISREWPIYRDLLSNAGALRVDKEDCKITTKKIPIGQYGAASGVTWDLPSMESCTWGDTSCEPKLVYPGNDTKDIGHYRWIIEPPGDTGHNLWLHTYEPDGTEWAGESVQDSERDDMMFFYRNLLANHGAIRHAAGIGANYGSALETGLGPVGSAMRRSFQFKNRCERYDVMPGPPDGWVALGDYNAFNAEYGKLTTDPTCAAPQ